jgi:hypothetical protein
MSVLAPTTAEFAATTNPSMLQALAEALGAAVLGRRKVPGSAGRGSLGNYVGGGRAMRKRDLLAAVVGAVAGALAVTGSAAAATRPALISVSIQGSAVVGQTLGATFEAAGDPPTSIEYQWRRCKADKPDECSDIKDAKAATYTVTPADLGFRLRVRVKLRISAGDDEDKSFPTAVVSALPLPQPVPAPASPSFPSSADMAPGGLRFLRPFPVVRVVGYLMNHGSRIVLWSVKAPRGAKIDVRCKGPRCPLRHRSFRPGRIRPLERYLRAGVAITIGVTRPGFIGTYTRVVIRSRKRPIRRDACLFPGDIRPRTCQGLLSWPN